VLQLIEAEDATHMQKDEDIFKTAEERVEENKRKKANKQ
jgi:hypothetical protein